MREVVEFDYSFAVRVMISPHLSKRIDVFDRREALRKKAGKGAAMAGRRRYHHLQKRAGKGAVAVRRRCRHRREVAEGYESVQDDGDDQVEKYKIADQLKGVSRA